MSVTTTNSAEVTQGRWAIEPSHSEIGFAVRHLGLSRVRGRFHAFDGTLTIGAGPEASSVEASIDLASIDTGNEDRDNHLRSTDFFDLEAHPRMTFRSTDVTAHTLTGELTINGVTRTVSLDYTLHGVTVDGYDTTRVGFSATGELNRSDFGIDFNAPLGMDGMLISDKVSIELEIQAVPA